MSLATILDNLLTYKVPGFSTADIGSKLNGFSQESEVGETRREKERDEEDDDKDAIKSLEMGTLLSQGESSKKSKNLFSNTSTPQDRCMADPELYSGFTYDEQGFLDILHSSFFDVNLAIDDTVEDYVERIIFTLSSAIEEQLGNTSLLAFGFEMKSDLPWPSMYFGSFTLSFLWATRFALFRSAVALAPKHLLRFLETNEIGRGEKMGEGRRRAPSLILLHLEEERVRCGSGRQHRTCGRSAVKSYNM
ncbi:hypothetical protein M5K25_014159 [Dendrobium thyrsiflorum]|uniref:Uncharacterized protein n=1 Tax=Dendrobium thyrsiflorum TaxID=117978 RepID=A0ABD0V1Z1_DENTH